MGRPGRRLVAAAAAGGLLTAAAFPLGPPLPIARFDGFWPAGWICLGPVVLCGLRARTIRAAAGLGLLAGAITFSLLLCWIDPFLVRWALLSRPEAAAVTSLLVLYLASYTAAFALAVRAWRGHWGEAAACLLAPLGWCALEWLRGTLLTGFPWCLLGYSQVPFVAAIQVADLFGVHGVSFVLACAGSLAAWLLRPLVAPVSGGAAAPAERIGSRWPWLLAAPAVAALAYGLLRLAQPPEPGPLLHAALVQADVQQSDKWDPAERLAIEADHVAMTRRAAGRGASLVVWSESAVPASITHDPAYQGRLEALSRETGADLLLGTVVYDRAGGEEVPRNSAVIVRPAEGLSGRYDKIHLVPFGEYVPLKRFLFFLEPLVHEASDFEPGSRVEPLRGGAAPLGTIICYEVIFPSLVRRFAREGAEILVNITNDAWYGDTAMPRQHLMHAVMRAVETRRPLLRCANTGISAFVDPVGRVASATRWDEKTILEGRVRPSTRGTLYTAAGDLLPIVCAIVALFALPVPRAAARPHTPSGGSDAR